MSLLALTGDELRQKLDAALASNPALELTEERRCSQCNRRLRGDGPCPICSLPRNSSKDEPIIFVSSRSDFHTGYQAQNEDDSSMEEWTAAVEDLPTFVLRQIAPDLPVEDRGIAAYILNSLDEDGLLRIPLIEIARYNHATLSRVQSVISLIQRAEPIGVGSSNPQEALLAQLNVLSETHPVPPHADRAIREGMQLLSRHAHAELGKLLGVPQEEAGEIAAFVVNNLNPYPARAHWGDIHSCAPQPQTYEHADMIIRLLDETPDSPLVVEIISPYAGALRVNPLFRKALSQAPKEKLEHWQADLENAALLIKCLQQRDHTLVRLMKKLVVFQRCFILEGEAHLEPLTRAQMAEILEVHESTISRAVSGKTLQLPNKRIIPLSLMFDRSLPARTILKNIIAQEEKPLSDQQITELLEERGFSVARRTVAKYRAMEGILPARMRKSNPASQSA
jgi:RNA polymerase sigma-54 factor